jgi:hypothetical protein
MVSPGFRETPAFLPSPFDLLHHPVQVAAGLGMHHDNIGPGLGKLFHIPFRFFNHQVHIQRQAGYLAYRLHHQWADGDVWYKAAIHDINMDVVGTGSLNSPDFVAQTGKISGKYGWCYLFHRLFLMRGFA